MNAPGVEENWLRGVRQGALAGGVTGATYTRSGTRSGLDPANLFFDNLIRSSEDFADAANWTAVTVTVTANSATSPSGTNNADTITPTSADSNIRQSFTPSGAVLHTFSVWLRSAIGSNISTTLRVWRDAPFQNVADTTITVTNIWQRFTLTFTALDATLHLAAIGASSTLSTGENLYAWGAQLVQGNVPGPYIPNPSTTLSASQVRREAGRGVRVFGAGTNLIRASEAFDDAVWTKTNSTVTANAAVAPNGTTTADKVIADNTNNFHQVGQGSTLVPSATYTLSTYVKKSEYDFAAVVTGASGGAGLSQRVAVINLATGALVSETVAGMTRITALANGWYRVAVTTAQTSGVGSPSFSISPLSTSSYTSYTGDGTSGILVWGAQLEQSTFATDYIPNASTVASASAGADDLQIAASSLPASGPIVFIADLPAQAIVGSVPRIFDWNNVIVARYDSTSNVAAVSDGSANGPAQGGLTVGGARRVAMLYTLGAPTKLSVNGGAVQVGTDTGAALPATTLFVGNRSALDRPLNGSIGIFAAYLGNPTDAQLQAMSALVDPPIVITRANLTVLTRNGLTVVARS
jgi:hypothetical protein